MAQTDIDRLDIRIDAVASDAEVRLQKLASSLQTIAHNIKKAAKALDIAQKSADEDAEAESADARETDQNAAAKERLSGASKKASGAIGKLMKSLGRIAFYRAIRTAIKNVSAAIREGLTNLYTYSQEVGTAFAPAVDNLRSHVMLLKNAFATALRPVLEALIPVVVQLVDALSKAADFMAQVFSVLFGKVDDQGRYTKAVLGDLEQSNKEAKELRRTLLGFDEINRLDGDTGRGTATAASTQFVQADVSESAKGIAEWIKGIDWKLVGDILKLVLTVIAAWKAAKFIANLAQIGAKLAPIVKAIGSFAAAHPVLLAIVAVLAVFTAYGEDIANWMSKARDKVDKFFESIKTQSSSANGLLLVVQGTLDFILESIGTVASMVYKLVHGDIAGALKDLVHLVATIINFIIDIVVGVVNFVLGILDEIYVGVMTIAQWIWNNALQPVFNWIAVAITNIDIWLKNAWVDIKTGFVIAAKWICDQVNKLVLQPLQDDINGMIKAWNDLFGTNVKPISITIDTSGFESTIESLQETKLEPISADVELVPKWNGKVEKLGLEIDPNPAKQFIRDIEKQLGDAIDRAFGKLGGAVNNVASAVKGIKENNSSKMGFAQYASGGYPTAGSMFIAGEPGAGAEWVGDINGRTSVLNSDQMAAAIYGAMSAALANNPSGGGDIYLDGEVIYKNMVRRNNNNVRATGRSALLT